MEIEEFRILAKLAVEGEYWKFTPEETIILSNLEEKGLITKEFKPVYSLTGTGAKEISKTQI